MADDPQTPKVWLTLVLWYTHDGGLLFCTVQRWGFGRGLKLDWQTGAGWLDPHSLTGGCLAQESRGRLTVS